MRGDEYLMTLVSMVYAKRLRCNGLTLYRQIIHLLSAIFYLFHTLPQAKFIFSVYKVGSLSRISIDAGAKQTSEPII